MLVADSGTNMSTDAVRSILGLTIDYGPYGWVDNFDRKWTLNRES